MTKRRCDLPGERWGKTEVAECLGVWPTNLDQIAGLPEPVQTLAQGRLWLADEVRKFAVEFNERRARRAARAAA